MTIIEMMQQEVDAMDRIGFPREQNLKAAVLKHGQVYELDRAASDEQERGRLKECFENAAQAALYGCDLTYVEGFAHSGWGMLVHHAWAVNAEGKAIELTWRDGTDECGFCVDGERKLDEDDEGYDEDDQETWHATCFWCEGSGRSPDGKHRSLEDAEYFGVEVDNDTLVKLLMKHEVWGVLNTHEDLDTILAAREAEAA